MLEIGSVVDGKYKVLDKIGQGGMSVVYLALNERANKTWAIKEVRKTGGEDFSVLVQGLIAETNLLKSLHHRYLPSIVDIIDDEDTFLIVMDYIQGESLREILRDSLQNTGHPIPVEDVIAWGIQLCEVLQYLHTRPEPIIYRDMKPANVIRKPDGDICLVDFGAARVYKIGNPGDTTCLGTPGYAAPEQYGGRGQTGPQTDIYNLGATLHHLVTGRSPEMAPFHFPKITECRPQLLSETPRELLGKLYGLETILERCTACDVSSRFQSCQELRDAMERAEDMGAPRRKILKRKLSGFATCLVAGVILGGISLGAMAMENDTREKGYEYYLEEAAVDPEVSGKIAYYTEAIALKPADGEAYLLLLDVMLTDNVFSLDDDSDLTAILNTKSSGCSNTNRDMLQTNEAGWVEFCYQLGVAYYYLYEGSNGRQQSVPYFQVVVSADMDSLDLDDSDGYKEAWQARAQILSTIGSASSRLGQSSASGDEEYHYSDYWYDLMELFGSGLAGQDNVVTELRLCNEIVVQTYSNAYQFKNDGISQEEMEAAMDDVEKKVASLVITGTTAIALEEEICENLAGARKMIDTVFGSTASN